MTLSAADALLRTCQLADTTWLSCFCSNHSFGKDPPQSHGDGPRVPLAVSVCVGKCQAKPKSLRDY